MIERWRKVNSTGETKKALEAHEFVGPNGEPQTAADLALIFENLRRKKLRESPALEAKKSLEEVEFIGMMQMMIAEERKRLGLSPGFYIQSERVRLYHPEVWDSDSRSLGGKRGGRGEYKPGVEDWAETQTKGPHDTFSPYAYFKTISHELIHQASYFETDPIGKYVIYRQGYRDHTNGTGVGLDEAMTESTNQELLERHADVLAQHFPANYEWWKVNQSYVDYCKVAQSVARRVDQVLYKNEAITWDNLKRGHLEGNPTALKDIESALGSDALQLLLLMGNPLLFDLKKASEHYSYKIENVIWAIDGDIEKYLTGDLSDEEKKRIFNDIQSLLKTSPDVVMGEITK